MTRVDPDSLTTSQRRAYEAREQRVLILGGPGTGKTTVALLSALRVLDEEPRGSNRRALFLTFSRAATRELLARAAIEAQEALDTRLDVATFHAFAIEVLSAFRRYAGGASEPVSILTPEESKLGLGRPGALEFREVLPSAVGLLRSAPWVASAYRQRYALVVCDEFQDTGDAAFELLQEISRDARLICLADEDQVIYDRLDQTVAGRVDRLRESGVAQYDLGYDSRRDPSNVIPRAAAAVRMRQFDHEAIREACKGGRLATVNTSPADDFQEVVVHEIRRALDDGAQDVGVFLGSNRGVTEMSDRLLEEEIPHEIAGLTAASGEAQLAIAECALYAVGAADWDAVLTRLGVFHAACYRSEPPALARQLVAGEAALPQGLVDLLARERTSLEALSGGNVNQYLLHAEGIWARVFVGRGVPLWQAGARDLRGQVLGVVQRLTPSTAEVLRRVAESRRTNSVVAEMDQPSAPVRLMTTHQVKGREMDRILLVHAGGDFGPWREDDMATTARLHYVALTRARQRATIVLASNPRTFFAPYAGLCGG